MHGIPIATEVIHTASELRKVDMLRLPGVRDLVTQLPA